MTVDTTHAQRQMFINGKWEDGGAGVFDDLNPATGEVWATIADASRNDATAAIEAAAAAQPAWAALPHSTRALYLHRAADALEARRSEFVDAIVDEGGGWFGKGMFETGYAMGLLRQASAAAYEPRGELLPSEHGKVSMVVREPVGVVSVISPWNFPLLLSLRAVGTALALGNAVVLKPSEETPVCGGLLIAKIFEDVELPAGVLNVITTSRDHVAEVGDEMIVHPAVGVISFTGSTAVGRQIGATAGMHLKKFSLELGGKDALLVLDDADLDRAVDAATFGSFMHQGQICMAAERIIVAEGVADDFIERFVAKVETLPVGDPRQNIVGPIINARQLAKIADHVADAVDRGATVLTGGTSDGPYYRPTVLGDVTPDMKVWREETFGPVAPVLRVAGDDEAIAAANDSDYGLSAGIISRNEERALDVARRLQTGMAHINCSPVNDEPVVPFGGAKQSGVGRHGGRGSIDAFTVTRWITLERGGRHYPF